jgi:hypothetical protein
MWRYSSETSVRTTATRRHIPEVGILHSHCSDNLTFYRGQHVLTCSYSLQLATITISKLWPAVFIRVGGSGGLRICAVETLSQISVNVYVTEIKLEEFEGLQSLGNVTDPRVKKICLCRVVPGEETLTQ